MTMLSPKLDTLHKHDNWNIYLVISKLDFGAFSYNKDYMHNKSERIFF
jgi:hypothetical protein